ncbi:MAG: hypothetical protein HC846_14330 [Blastocatellia bacterium]|nr:hypothetical protein [Blastocatellia bacterium]
MWIELLSNLQWVCIVFFIGINVGSLGFLTDVQAHQLPLALKQIWAGETILESRSLIEATARSGADLIAETALNDFVISRGACPAP